MAGSGSTRVATASLVLGAIVLLAAGCGKEEELPKTYAVHGKVVKKDGQPYTVGGAIMFRPVDNYELQAYGELFENGTFTLHTLGRTKTAKTKRLDGAVEGECKVQIEPPMGKGRPFWLNKTVRIEPNENNEITVVLDK